MPTRRRRYRSRSCSRWRPARCCASVRRPAPERPTGDYGIGATDLCEFVEFPTELLQVCGDSFAGQGVGFGGWYSPVALRVDTASVDDPGGVRYTGVTGVEQTAAGRSHAAGGLAAARRGGADQPAQLPDGDHHQEPRAAELPAGRRRTGTRRLADHRRDPATPRRTRAARRRRSAATTTRSPPPIRRADGCTSSPTASPAETRCCCTGPRRRPSPTGRGGRAGRRSRRRLEQAADAAVGRRGGRDVHPADRRQGRAVLFQCQHRQHGGPGGRRPDVAG